MKRKSDVEEGGGKRARVDKDDGDAAGLTTISLLSSFCKSKFSPSPETVSAALEHVRNASDPRLRMWALRFLVSRKSSLQPQELHDLVLNCCFDPRAYVREAALNAAAQLDYHHYHDVATTFTLMKDQVPSVRLSAINLIGLQARSCEDISDYAYLQLCRVLTGTSMQGKEQACIVLRDIHSVSENVVLHSLNKKSQLQAESVVANGKHLPGTELKLLLESAAGAFVQAVEDEFYQVRTSAIQALVKLASSKNIIDVVSELLMDLANDQHIMVRTTAIQGLSQMIKSVTLRDKHVNMTFRLLEDSSKVTRDAGRELLSSVVLPAMKTVKLALEILLKCVVRYQEDKNDMLLALHSLGRVHSQHVELFMDTLVSQMTADDIDEDALEALLSFCRGALSSNKNVAYVLPKRITQRLEYAAAVSEPDVNNSGSSTVRHIVDRALSVKELPKSEDKLGVLSKCRSDLSALNGCPSANLALLYVEFLTLVVTLRSTAATAPATGGDRSRLHDRLGFVLAQIQQRFSGLTPDGIAQLLEMEAYYYTILGNEDCLSRLSCTTAEWQKLLFSGNISDPESFPLLKEGAENGGQTFWPRHCIVEDGTVVREMWVDLRVPESDVEHPRKFISGLPLEVKVTGVVRRAQGGQRLWVQMDFKGLESSRQYRLLELNTRGTKCGAAKDVNFADVLEFYNMPAAALGVLRVSVLLELSCGKWKEQVHCRGPTRGHCVVISSEQVLHLSRAG